jgi:hypothetical protein
MILKILIHADTAYFAKYQPPTIAGYMLEAWLPTSTVKTKRYAGKIEARPDLDF